MKSLRHWILIISILCMAIPAGVYAQQAVIGGKENNQQSPKDWHLLDRKETGYYGISLDKAYDFLKGKKSTPVIVGVIDSGIDTLHEALRPVLWKNPGEIPGNGKDDDKNGYIDDVHGWNFLGGKDGSNVKEDSYEAARIYWKLRNIYGNTIPDTVALRGEDKAQAVMYLKAKNQVVDEIDPVETMMAQRLLPVLEKGDAMIAADLGKKEFDGHDLLGYRPQQREARTTAAMYMNIFKLNNSNDITNNQILESIRGDIKKGEAATTPPKDFRGDIVRDNYADFSDRFYGNSDIMAGTPYHGTHVAGIIGAVMIGDDGVRGIANNVRIMALRAVPDGDEHDKDIANAIRYAVDNGAKVINMSFGKSFSPQKKWVDRAIRYAAEKDVLIVHAAGNDGKDIDESDNFPTPVFLDGSKAKNYISVGANGDPENGGFTASFTNYGKNLVDVFAPGVDIYSTVPGEKKYGKSSGTSMAAPVVSGVAALIRQYYPELSAEQVKYAIEKSVTPEEEEVILPKGDGKMVAVSDISKTGGQINAYQAVKIASTLKPGQKVPENL